MKLCCTAVMLALLVGCGTASRVVRLDTGQAVPLVFTPRSCVRPVALGNGDFEEAVSELARDVRPPTRPQEAARRLFEVEARSGSYTYETPGRRITPLEPGNWHKVYKDGWIGSKKVSLHYFESPSGKVFDFKIKLEWSNQ
jgi:hypothetical protein